MKIFTKFIVAVLIVIIFGLTISILNTANEKVIPLISAIVGAGFALLGTWLNNYWTDKRSLKERKNAILLASLDKRLTAHQEAYNYLRKLYKTANEDWDGGTRKTNLKPIIEAAHDFWDKNTLYLTEEASKHFHFFIFNIIIYNKEDPSQLEIEIVDKHLINAGRALKQGVEIYLPDKTLIDELKDKNSDATELEIHA